MRIHPLDGVPGFRDESLSTSLLMRCIKGPLVLFILFAAPVVSWAQDQPNEAGAPFFFEHYKPQDYQHNPQNWSVVQDQEGVVFLANHDGILSYDGSQWRFIDTATNTIVRSLALGTDGAVYIGTYGDFGYLAPDSTGTLHYVSLIDNVPVEDRVFTDVWGTHATSEGVYFQTYERVFRWDGKTMKSWDSQNEFRTSFAVQDRFYVRDKGIGLQQIVSDSLQLVPNGEAFASRYIYMMVPYDGNRLLIGTSNAGLWLYDDGRVSLFPTAVDAILKDYTLYHGAALPHGRYALATLGGGVLIIDHEGQLIQVLNKDTGMPDNWINYVYADRQGGLWMALDAAGIVRVDVPSQLTVYDDHQDLHGTIYTVARHQDELYVGTSTSLFKVQPATEGVFPSVADVIPRTLRGTGDSGAPTPALLSADSVLFAATHKGLYVIRHGVLDTVKYVVREGVLDTVKADPFFALAQSATHPGEVLVGMRDGVARLTYETHGWTLETIFGGSSPAHKIKSILEEKEGTLWLRGADNAVTRLQFSDAGTIDARVQYSYEDGVPEDLFAIESLDGQAVFVAEQGVFRFDASRPAGEHFVRDASFDGPAAPNASPLRSFKQDPYGNVWLVFEDRVVIAKPQGDGSYQYEEPPVLRFAKSTVANVFVDTTGVAWIGSGDALVRYNPRLDKDYTVPYTTLLRRIVATRTERVLYGGASLSADVRLPSIIDHVDNDLRFEVSAPSYNDVEANRYQFYMEGYDADWSSWSPQPNRTYNGLAGGAYTLRVRARNAHGILSGEAVFSFHVLPPWYRTWWAYSLYLVFALGLTAFSIRHYQVVQENKRAQEQARELERERLVNKRLQEANDSLTQANKLKDEFLANTSHELRTPLTAILGFSALLREELPEYYLELLDPIESNGQRLLRTVNSLLDIARLRAGMLELQPQVIAIGDQVAEVMRLLAPLAQHKNLPLNLVQPPEPVHVHLDPHRLEQILNNLIGNAIKFTDEGSVSVEVERQASRVAIHVRDTGVGIDESFMPHLFDEFKQESTGLARLHEGNGLGLAITARLVELMGGRIHVESVKDVGSNFTVSFPLYLPEPSYAAVTTHSRPPASSGASAATW